MIRGIIQTSIVLLSFALLPLQAQAPTSDPLGRLTPRGTVVGFLTAAHRSDWHTAIQYLESTKGEDPTELATQLSVVLDQGLPANLDQLSDQPQGTSKTAKELVGTIDTRGGPLNVTLDHVTRGSQILWLFAPDTLKEIPAVYDEFNSGWIPDYVPKALLRRGWLGIPLWQWLVLAIGVGLALLFAAAMRVIAVPVLRYLFRSVAQDQDEWLLNRIIGPLRGLVSLFVLQGTIQFLHLPLFARQFWYFTGGALTISLAGWVVVRLVEVSARLFDRHAARRGAGDTTAVIRLVQRTLTVFICGIVLVKLLQLANLLKDASALLAGVGVGGIAIALAAQKTLENVVGGISIIFDKTIRVGDPCRIGTQSGTVEDIGLRSTSLRTDARTILTVPNGQLATMTIENMTMREKLFFRHVVSIRCETSARQMRSLLDALRQLLAADKRLEASSNRVRLIRFGPSSLDLEIVSYILTTDDLKFMEVQEELLLKIMDTIEAAGTAMAYPSQTLLLGRDPGLPTVDSPHPAEPAH
jgi:MscS family membrane protein